VPSPSRLILTMALASFSAGVRADGPSPVPPVAREASKAMYERLKSLAGTWRGTVEWTGARTGSGTMTARYYVTGNGTALVEDLESDGTIAMTSVYHLDGSDLRLTHFCGAGNQPRLKASVTDPPAGHVRFAFVDITNLKTPESGHVSAVELRLDGAQKMTLIFTFVGGGRESYERIELTRVTDHG
jgi:hypothetical protein